MQREKITNKKQQIKLLNKLYAGYRLLGQIFSEACISDQHFSFCHLPPGKLIGPQPLPTSSGSSI